MPREKGEKGEHFCRKNGKRRWQAELEVIWFGSSACVPCGNFVV